MSTVLRVRLSHLLAQTPRLHQPLGMQKVPKVPQASLAERVAVEGARKWNIPEVVERGYEIPICITNTDVVPSLGQFKRLGMDVVVNAAWLAYFWAKEEGNEKAVSALMKLMLDWPMDFVLIQGDSAEEIKENMFNFGVNVPAKVERLREFVGLENMNLMRIVAHATDIVKAKLVHGKKANAEVVHQWLVANIHWGAMKTPEMETVQRLVTSWVGISKDERASNLLGWPTKIG